MRGTTHTFRADPQLVLFKLEGESHLSSGLIVHAGQGESWQALLETHKGDEGGTTNIVGQEKEKRDGTRGGSMGALGTREGGRFGMRVWGLHGFP